VIHSSPLPPVSATCGGPPRPTEPLLLREVFRFSFSLLSSFWMDGRFIHPAFPPGPLFLPHISFLDVPFSFFCWWWGVRLFCFLAKLPLPIPQLGGDTTTLSDPCALRVNFVLWHLRDQLSPFFSSFSPAFSYFGVWRPPVTLSTRLLTVHVCCPAFSPRSALSRRSLFGRPRFLRRFQEPLLYPPTSEQDFFA